MALLSSSVRSAFLAFSMFRRMAAFLRAFSALSGSSSGSTQAWATLTSTLREHGEQVSGAQTIEQARAGFESLSNAMVRLLARFGNPLERDVHLAHCPMAARNEGAQWLQAASAVDNPYFGASMPGCGDIRKRLAPGAYLRPLAASSTGGHEH